MSFWTKIEDQDDVELSEDGTTIDVCWSSDNLGNNYIEIPIEFIKKALNEKETRR